MRGSHLAIEIASNAVRFVSMRNETVLSRLDQTISAKTDSESKEALKAIFEANSFLQGDFDEVSLAWCIDKSSLVPNAVFNESTPLDILTLLDILDEYFIAMVTVLYCKYSLFTIDGVHSIGQSL